MLRRLIDSPWLFYGLAALLLVAAVMTQIRFSPEERTAGTIEDVRDLRNREDLNVVFIVIDMLRADRLGMYGYERDTSPLMDELASTGIRFAHVESQSSWTKASMASLWTGMYPERTGIQRFFHAMPQEAHMPAEIFKDAGYRTAGVWRNGWIANNFGFDQGFDLYIRPKQNRPEYMVKQNVRGQHRLPGNDMDATLSALEFMHGAVNDPFFLYIHYMDVHQYLYTDLSPNFGSGFSDFYDSSIYWTDYNIGRIMDGLRGLGIADETLVVIVSDHGEAFFEHGIEGHAKNIYTEVVTTPWVIVLPFELEQGIVVNQRVANVDVWPTLLDLLGMPPLDHAEGQSLVPAILAAGERARAGEPPEPVETDRVIVSQLDRSWGRIGADPNPTASLVKGSHRLYYRSSTPDRLELFDHREDPGEQRNVVALQPEVAEALRQDLDAFYAMPKPWAAAPEIEVNEMRQNQLRALGYILQPAHNRKKGEGGEGAEEGVPAEAPPPSPQGASPGVPPGR